MTKSNSTRNRFVSFNTSSLEDVHLSGEDQALCATDENSDNLAAATDADIVYTDEEGNQACVSFCGLWIIILRLFGCDMSTNTERANAIGVIDR
jgi:hypothetical protein